MISVRLEMVLFERVDNSIDGVRRMGIKAVVLPCPIVGEVLVSHDRRQGQTHKSAERWMIP